jgi:hypothetical protein
MRQRDRFHVEVPRTSMNEHEVKNTYGLAVDPRLVGVRRRARDVVVERYGHPNRSRDVLVQ